MLQYNLLYATVPYGFFHYINRKFQNENMKFRLHSPDRIF